MIIILEGFDNSGKSTLAKRLKACTGFQYFHPGGSPKSHKEMINDLEQQLQIVRAGSQLNIIMDRTTCVSEWCYSLKADESYHALLEQYWRCTLARQDVAIIWCKPPRALQEDFSKHEKAAHDTTESVEHAKQNAQEIILRYEEVYNRIKVIPEVRLYVYDYTQRNGWVKLTTWLGVDNE